MGSAGSAYASCAGLMKSQQRLVVPAHPKLMCEACTLKDYVSSCSWPAQRLRTSLFVELHVAGWSGGIIWSEPSVYATGCGTASVDLAES